MVPGDRLQRELLVFLSSGTTGLSQGLWFKNVGVVDIYGQKAGPAPSELLQGYSAYTSS